MRTYVSSPGSSRRQPAAMSGVWKRVLVVVVVVVASLWAIYPPDSKIKLGLDLNGGVHLVLRVKPRTANAMRSDTVEQALHTIERRVNELGVAEAVVARYTEADQILVQLPGVTDVDRAKQIIKSTAQLRLTLVERGPFPDRDAALQAYGGSLPPDLEVLPGPIGSSGAETFPFYVVQKAAVVAGNDLRDARQSLDEFNRPAVAFTLKPDAGRRFGAFTERHVNRALATVLDDRVTSVATILSRIDDHGQITGISREEMNEQVITFKSGALPADLEYVEERTVGASLGAASIRSGVLASVGGLTLVALFMLAYYRLTGLNALMSILLNLLILLALVAFIPVTMTLPGIAGLILTIGMGVDSNVLIFERIKEELAKGRSQRAAVIARVRPRVDHDRRHARHVAHRSCAPLSIRHQPHPRLCDDVDDRPRRERLHRGLRVESHVRADVAAPRGRHSGAELLRPGTSIFEHQFRLHPVGAARHRPVAGGHRRRRWRRWRPGASRSGSTFLEARSSSSSSHSRASPRTMFVGLLRRFLATRSCSGTDPRPIDSS